MKKIAVFLANGCEEIEALTPVDVLRRAGAVCDTVSVCDRYVTGSHGIIFKADKLLDEFNENDYDAIILPGGMPGAKILGECSLVIRTVESFDAQHKIIGAICAAPAVVLGMNGLSVGRKVTCYPSDSFINVLEGADYTGNNVETDQNLITANGPKSAMQFSLEICASLGLNPQF